MSEPDAKRDEEIEELRTRIAQMSAMMANMIHEMEILKEALFQQGTLSPNLWEKCFREQKRVLLWSPKVSQRKAMERYRNDDAKWQEEFSGGLPPK